MKTYKFIPDSRDLAPLYAACASSVEALKHFTRLAPRVSGKGYELGPSGYTHTLTVKYHEQ